MPKKQNRTEPPQPRVPGPATPRAAATPALTSAHLDAIRYDQQALSAKTNKEAKIYQGRADAIRAELYPRVPSQVERASSQLNAKVAQQARNASGGSGAVRAPAARGGMLGSLMNRFGGGLKGSSK